MSHKSELGFIDRMLEKLPEIHIRGYNYCGINTKLLERLTRGDVGINKLDEACMAHDIAYAENSDIESRSMADKILVSRAIVRIFAQDSQVGERSVALLVSWLISMKLIFCKLELLLRIVRRYIAVKLKRKSPESV